MLLVSSLGFFMNVALVLDAQVFHWLLRAPDARSTDEAESLDRLRQSIVFVRANGCSGAPGRSGTGFVVAPGVVATAAHVLEEADGCGAEVQILDANGSMAPAEIEGLSGDDDLALLKLRDSTLPALTLADSQAYEANPGLVAVLTIGYPLPGAGSEPGEAAPSGDGNLSHFDSAQKRFVISGIKFNPGSSGGPVFVKDDWKVLGVAVPSIDPKEANGLGLVVPAENLRRFFRERLGTEIGS